MTGLMSRFRPVETDALLARLTSTHTLEIFYGRHLTARTVAEIWRVWPALSIEKRLQLRDLLWQTGVTPGLIAQAAKSKGQKRSLALNRLLALGDPRSLGPLLNAWSRFNQMERDKILDLAARFDHKHTARLLWREIAAGSPDPYQTMAQLVRRLGKNLLHALGALLAESEPELWVWETLERLGGRAVQEQMLTCLGRHDKLGERAKYYFGVAADVAVLPMLMQAARFHLDWEVRIGAVAALFRRKEPQALRFLTELLQDQSWYHDPIKQPQGGGQRLSWPGLFGLHAAHRLPGAEQPAGL